MKIGHKFWALVAMLAIPAAAFAEGDNRDLAPLYACQNETNVLERLACYDEVVAGLRVAKPIAKPKGKTETSSPKTITKTEKKNSFGFSVPRFPTLSRQSPSPSNTSESVVDNDRVTLELKSVHKRNTGRYRFEMTNGQVWDQTESASLRDLERRPPKTATIRKAALGSFMMKLDNQRKGFRVKRIK